MSLNWEIIELGEMCEVVTKGTTPTSIGFKYQESGINFIKIESIDSSGRFIPEKFAYIDEEANDALKRSKLKSGDILFSIAGALGRAAIVTDDVLPANTNQALSIIRLNEGAPVTKEYLFSALSTGFSLEQIEKFKGGVAQQNLSLTQIKNFKIPIPPLPEQKRIVEILDEAFEAIDQARANVERIIQNAEELFQSKLNEIFTQRGEGWEEESLKNISKIMYGHTDKSSADFNGPKYLRITDIQDNNVDWINVPHCHQMEDEYEKYQLHYGDIVFARTGATTGKSYLIVDPPKAVFASYLIRVQADLELLKPDFLFWYFQSPKYWQIINKGISGSAQGGFNATKLGKLSIPIPPTDIQDQIVEEVNSLYEVFESLLSIYKNKIEGVEELKKSILQKAFSGELTANEHVVA